MRVRSLVSSTVTLIKHTDPKASRYYSGYKRTFRKISPLILRQLKSEGKDPKKQRSKPSQRTKPSKQATKSPELPKAKHKAKDISADTNHPSDTTFTVTKIPLRAPFIRRHISASVFHKVTPKNKRFQRIPSGPGIQHPTTTTQANPEPAPNPIPKSSRKREHTFRKLDPWLSPSHPKYTTIPPFRRPTPSSAIRIHISSTSSQQIPLDKSYRPRKNSADIGIIHPAPAANTKPKPETSAEAEAEAETEKEARMSDPTQNPSQLHGHATYVAGAAKEALGFASGKEDKEYAVAEMRAAKEQAEGEPAKNETMGKMEEKLGAATGCEGMVGEGKERQS